MLYLLLLPQGDNGGPLVWVSPDSGALQLVGVVSYGEGCPGDKPVISTRVTHYLRWIQQVTRGENVLGGRSPLALLERSSF